MNTKTKLLLTLLQDRTKKFTIRQLAKTTNIDYKNAYQTIKQLNKSTIQERVANLYQISAATTLTPELFAAEIHRQQALPKQFVEDLKAVPHLFIAVVFESRATKTHSDMDLCIISENNEIHKIIEKATPFTTEIHFFTPEQFLSMKQTLAREIAREGIVIKNIEGYYALIKNIL